MQETTNKALFSLGQLVATPGALASLAKAGQTPSTSCRGTYAAIGATSTKRTGRKTNSASNEAFGFSAVTARTQAQEFGSSPKPTVP